MVLPKFSATEHFKMVSPGEHIKDEHIKDEHIKDEHIKDEHIKDCLLYTSELPTKRIV